MSTLSKAFSGVLLRGVYKDEKPVVDIPMQGSKREQKRLTSLINKIAKNSEFGKSVLEDAAKGGYELSFEFCGVGCCGKDDNNKKFIALNPRFSDATLTYVLAHEARHAQQEEKGCDSDLGKLNIKSEIMQTRAAEADAQAAATMTMLEIRANTNSDVIWDNFVSRSANSCMADRLPEDVTKKRLSYGPFKATPELMKASFEGWYDNRALMDAYENNYIRRVMNRATALGEEDTLAYSKEISSKEIVNMFCHMPDGKNYLADTPNILENSLKLSISEETAITAANFFLAREKAGGKKPDESYKHLPKRDAIGLVSSYGGGIAGRVERYERPKEYPSSAKMLLTVKNGKGR